MSSLLENFRDFIKNNQNDLILVFGVILISLISFGAGRLTTPAVVSPEPIVIEQNTVNQEQSYAKKESGDTPLLNAGLYVASVSGSKYHLPECSGAKRIKEENKIWFSSKEEAGKMGYTPAANCPGL